MLPFQLNLDPASFRAYPGVRANLRRLADVADIFRDQAETARRLAENPPVYEFYDLREATPGSLLSFGLTVISPGAVSGEYFMTRGHFHALRQDGDELYISVSGAGLLQLQSRQGEYRQLELLPGGMLYTPLAWAHRTVNTGAEPLVFFSIWPAATAYDYEEITRRGGFPQRVFNRGGSPAQVANLDFHF